MVSFKKVELLAGLLRYIVGGILKVGNTIPGNTRKWKILCEVGFSKEKKFLTCEKIS